MPRIRSIKPEFWSSEQIVNCSRDARLLFIGMWNYCDDHGIHPASCKRLSMEVFPGDHCAEETIRAWMDELIKNKLVFEYRAVEKNELRDFWQVTGWEHQKINRRNPPRFPLPEKQKLIDCSDSYQCIDVSSHDSSTVESLPSQCSIAEDSSSIQCSLSVDSLNDQCSDTPGREKEKEGSKDIREVASATPPPSSVKKLDSAITSDVGAVFAYWQKIMGKSKARLDNKRKSKIQQALRNYSMGEVKLAIAGCSKSDFHMGKNQDHKRYDGIALILRDSEHIEKFIELAKGVASSHVSPIPAPSDELMAGVI